MADKSPDFNDVKRLLAHKLLVVGITQVELKSGATPAQGREEVIVYNDSSQTVFVALNGVTISGANKGWPVAKNTFVTFPADENPLYVIGPTAGNNVICFEFGDQ